MPIITQNPEYSNVRHPRCVLYNSKQLGMLTLTVEHNYICYYIIGVYNNDMFQPYILQGTMVPCNIMISRTRPIMPQDHYTHASIA